MFNRMHPRLRLHRIGDQADLHQIQLNQLAIRARAHVTCSDDKLDLRGGLENESLSD